MIPENFPKPILNRIQKFVSSFVESGVNSVGLLVPLDMLDGPVDKNEWARWKPIDSPIQLNEIERIEKKYGVKLPLLFSAYLMYKSLMMTNFIVNLPETPSDRPLEQALLYLDIYNEHDFFKKNKLLPFGDYNVDHCLLCFDLKKQENKYLDCPIVHVDADLSNEPGYVGKRMWNSFSDLLDEIEKECFGDEVTR